MLPRVRPPAGTLAPSSSRRHRHLPPTWPTSMHPSRWFFPSYQQTPRRPALAPGVDHNAAQQWPKHLDALLHRTVVRSGLQRHRKVSRLRMVIELPATATPPHSASACASLLSKPSRCHRAIRVPTHHRPRIGAISTELRLHTVSPLHVLAITHHTKEQASTASHPLVINQAQLD